MTQYTVCIEHLNVDGTMRKKSVSARRLSENTQYGGLLYDGLVLWTFFGGCFVRILNQWSLVYFSTFSYSAWCLCYGIKCHMSRKHLPSYTYSYLQHRLWGSPRIGESRQCRPHCPETLHPRGLLQLNTMEHVRKFRKIFLLFSQILLSDSWNSKV